jgi:hypothetical protein
VGQRVKQLERSAERSRDLDGLGKPAGGRLGIANGEQDASGRHGGFLAMDWRE